MFGQMFHSPTPAKIGLTPMNVLQNKIISNLFSFFQMCRVAHSAGKMKSHWSPDLYFLQHHHVPYLEFRTA